MAKIAEVQEVTRTLLKPYERNAKVHGAEQVDNAESQERDISEIVTKREGRFVQAHDKMLTFVKGDGKRAAAKLGSVNTDTGDEYFEVNIDA